MYGINLEWFLKEDLNLTLHGKCLCQEFENMLVHYVKTNVLVKHFTLHRQRKIALNERQHVPPDKIFTECCDRFTCNDCFLFSCVKDWSRQHFGLASKTFLSFPHFSQRNWEKTICFRYDTKCQKETWLSNLTPSSDNETEVWKCKQCIEIRLDGARVAGEGGWRRMGGR